MKFQEGRGHFRFRGYRPVAARIKPLQLACQKLKPSKSSKIAERKNPTRGCSVLTIGQCD
jgi:hypothetical protein